MKFFRDLGEISARSRPRSRRDENLGGQKRAEITGEISARKKSRRPKTRRDYWRDLGEKKISAAKNAPRLVARSRRDENLGGQKRAEITGEISARKKSRRPKTRRDYWRDLGEKKISAAKNAPRLVARSRRDENLGGQKRAEIRGEISAAKIAPRLREISAAKIASSSVARCRRRKRRQDESSAAKKVARIPRRTA